MTNCAIDRGWSERAAVNSPPNVLLLGYYGFGNFGDDVLFRVAAQVARNAWPGCVLSTRSAAPSPEYLEKLAFPVHVLPYSKGQRFDVILHGGGGTFFDFTDGGWLRGAANGLVLFAGGRPFSAVDSLLRKVLGRPRDTATVRLGIGLGIGTFTRNSPSLRHKVPALVDFDSVMVRDLESMKNLQRLGIQVPASCGSDIAFLHEHWREKAIPGNRRVGRPRIGLILRDWPSDSSLSSMSQSVLANISALRSEFDFTVFLFDRQADSSSLGLLEKRERVSIWDPAVDSIEEFSAQLVSMDVLVTTRAHGAICGAVLGVPSVIMEVEPKLRAVHDMLPKSSRLLGLHAGSEDIRAAIRQLLVMPGQVLHQEVDVNRGRAVETVNKVLKYAREALNVGAA